MSNNFTAEQIAWIVIFLWLGGLLLGSSIMSIKAKAFNEGFKRGRASMRAHNGTR